MADLCTQIDVSCILVQHDMKAQHKSCVHGGPLEY